MTEPSDILIYQNVQVFAFRTQLNTMPGFGVWQFVYEFFVKICVFGLERGYVNVDYFGLRRVDWEIGMEGGGVQEECH